LWLCCNWMCSSGSDNKWICKNVSHPNLQSIGANSLRFWWQEMLLLLLPLLNSSSVKNLLRPFSKDKSSSSSEDGSACPICLATPTIPYVALPCQHRYITAETSVITIWWDYGMFIYANLYVYIHASHEKWKMTKQLFTFCVADIVTTVLGHDVLLLHHLGVPGAVSQLLLCNGIVVAPRNDWLLLRNKETMLELGNIWSTYII